MAIRALTKTLFVFENRLTSEEIDYAEKTLDSLLLYSKFPEIMYRKSTIPMHVLFHELEMVQALFEKNADIRNHFAILKNFPEKGLSAMTVEGLIQIYFDTEMEFFLETALRILCYSSEELPEGDSRYRKCLCEIAESLGKTSVRYMQETEETEQKLLKDNRQAVKNITMRINRLAEKYEMNFNIGTVHFLY